MRRPPIRIRTFILGSMVALVLLPTLAAGAAWLIERDRQQAAIEQRLRTATDYLGAHRSEIQEPTVVQGVARVLDRLDLLAQLVIAEPGEKRQFYISPALGPTIQKEQARRVRAGTSAKAGRPTPVDPTSSRADDHRLIPIGHPGSQAYLVADLYYRPASRATRALVALITGILALLVGLAVVVWLAGRWMVAPLGKLSAQVDNVAGGDLTIALPRSRIGEITNIAQAVGGLTAALGENEQRRAEADEARRFLVTSIAHDLRTPLFALRGHLQAIRARLGDPSVHLERAEARADALERLIGNLFAYTRDDFTQPAPQLTAIPIADVLEEVTTSLAHTARLRDNRFELEGHEGLTVIVDRDRMRRALTNVLDNALRYSPPHTSIHLSWSAADEATVQVAVEDHGPGIDPELLPHIFEPGIRGAPAADGPHDGAGLGLTIAKRLLEHQHATLTVHNHPAGGAVVTVILQQARSANPT